MAKGRKIGAARPDWPAGWSVGVQTWIERKDEVILDEAAADVLLALDRTKSISAAARTVGISYRHAWLLIERANKSAGARLVETAIGGKRGGGAQLTEDGRAALAAFRQIQEQVRTAAAQALPRIVTSTTDQLSVLHLAAAISLQEVIAQVLNEYALVRPTVAVRTIFGSSNELADQIAAGGSADVFISASGSHIDRLAKSGLIDKRSRCKLASNGLAIVGDVSLAGKFKRPSDLRKLSGVGIVAADPACPLGQCTSEFLRSIGLLDDLRPRMQLVDNSRAVVTSLRAGGSQVGVIFGSDVSNAVGLATLMQVPVARTKANYEGAALRASKTLDESRALLRFFATDKARGCFRRCGFVVDR
jgi:molybdate transport system substrate-binding protein